MSYCKILIFGSSRPRELQRTMESLDKFLITRNKNITYLAHEDFVIPEKSFESLEVLKKHNVYGIFHNPNIGLGLSMTSMFNMFKCKYIVNWQDDWVLEKPVDLDELLYTMDTHKEINQIVFNKRRNSDLWKGVEREQYLFNEKYFCLNDRWLFLPSIWRMNFVGKHWKPYRIEPEGQFSTTLIAKFGKYNAGSYLYDKIYSSRYVEHIGRHTMNEWNYGHIHDEEINKYRAKWIKENYE